MGQIDAIWSLADNPVFNYKDDYPYYKSEGSFYNYTKVMELDPTTNFAPRKQMWGSKL